MSRSFRHKIWSMNGVPTNIDRNCWARASLGAGGDQPVDRRPRSAAFLLASYGSAGQARKHSTLGTQVATAVQQGAQDFRCVRVTDGSDTAASYAFFYGSGTSFPALLTATLQRVDGQSASWCPADRREARASYLAADVGGCPSLSVPRELR